MEKFFQLKKNNTNVSTEMMAGITTFFAMSYILFVNSTILSASGMPFQAVFLDNDHCFSHWDISDGVVRQRSLCTGSGDGT